MREPCGDTTLLHKCYYKANESKFSEPNQGFALSVSNVLFLHLNSITPKKDILRIKVYAHYFGVK